MNLRDLIRETLPASLIETSSFQVGAIIGDDARAHQLSAARTMFASVLINGLTLALTRQLEILQQLGVSLRARRQVAELVAHKILAAGGGPFGRPRVN